jgi:hypothetical protein
VALSFPLGGSSDGDTIRRRPSRYGRPAEPNLRQSGSSNGLWIVAKAGADQPARRVDLPYCGREVGAGSGAATARRLVTIRARFVFIWLWERGMEVGQRGNQVLAVLLAELGWSPIQLAGLVNAVLGPGYVARSTASDWLNQNRLPREPLPTVVAHLISDALGRDVSVARLWSGRAQPAEFWVPADHGLQLPWTTAGTVEALDDWLRHTGGSIGMDRRIFMAVSGAALTAPAWGYVDHLGIRGISFAALADQGRNITVTPAMVDAVAAATAGIRNLSFGEGGTNDNLRFLHHHLLWVAKLLRQGRFTNSAVADRLLTEFAQLADLGAFMAHDAGQHGLSQRYFTSGLHAAHTAGDRTVGTVLLARESERRVIQGRLNDGVDLGRAARDAVELANAAYEVAKSTSAFVRAQAVSALANAQAAVGNAHGYHVAADQARNLLDTPGALDTRPHYLTWYGPNRLESGLAQDALTLAGVSSRDCRRLLEDADTALGRTATDPATTNPRAVFSAALLSRAHIAAGNLDRAVPAAQTALRRLPTVRSRRCTLILRRLEEDLAALSPARRPAAVRSLHDQLRAARAT